MDLTFPIADLRTLVALALKQADYVPTASARVRAVPDTRTIRYYTTLGLVDRPKQMRGRTAYYGPKHVMQLVAIKRLQAENLTLSDIQERLVALPPKRLKTLAKLPTDFWENAKDYLDAPPLKANHEAISVSSEDAQPARSGEEFWSRTAATPTRPRSPHRDQSVTGISQSLCIRLHPQVQMSIDTTAPAEVIDAARLQRLQSAAESLISELVRQGLIDTPSPPRQDARS
ncbi:MerR family transcriptional regulator [Rhodopirellula sp. SWK7]|uniref:helix-turn-helix domain-containing protein n=1 Tax=Rhodopirellula sp. SWK7 TaxID=595460 RepID=UPI0002BFC7E7|nr:helix-turn-helix domain-containing protein [Rhodopirellula sp. SWK7]EMI42076.1 transcriptional regulator, MerR family [Rhodopirellula sp. SWK7]